MLSLALRGNNRPFLKSRNGWSITINIILLTIIVHKEHINIIEKFANEIVPVTFSFDVVLLS